MEPRPAWATPLKILFLIAAILCFLLAFFGDKPNNTATLGLAFFAGAFLF